MRKLLVILFLITLSQHRSQQRFVQTIVSEFLVSSKTSASSTVKKQLAAEESKWTFVPLFVKKEVFAYNNPICSRCNSIIM